MIDECRKMGREGQRQTERDTKMGKKKALSIVFESTQTYIITLSPTT